MKMVVGQEGNEQWEANGSKSHEMSTYVITCQLLRSQDPVIRVMGFLIGKDLEDYFGNVQRADPWSFTISIGRIEFAIILDRMDVLLVGELFPLVLSAEINYKTTQKR